MNRKQKIAVVVGSVVITFLALFPPWRASITVNTRMPDVGMDLTVLTPEDDLRPGTGPDAVIETGVYTFDGFRWIGAPASRASAETIHAEPHYEAAISVQLAALALAVAAVVVLKERKAEA